MYKPPVSIIVPAHNEADVIQRCLSALTRGASDGELRIIVVSNACDDQTASLARAFGHGVQVIETDVPSKTNALNLGDRAAETGHPHVYVDADVVMSLDSLRLLVHRLERGDVLAAAPRIQLALDRCSWAVRAFYAVDMRMPSHRESIGGSGVYALSEAGRARFGEFPRITADDAFVRRHFKPAERCRVEEAFSIVTPPRTLSGLVTVKTRSHFGNYEINKLYPHLTANRGRSNLPALLKLALRPWWWPRLAVYSYVKGAARVRSMWRYHFGDQRKWERDQTSRAPTVAPSEGARTSSINPAPGLEM